MPDEVEIFFKGMKVQSLTKTILVFWNSGSTTIFWKDIVESEPITISFGQEYEILRAVVIKRTREVNKFQVEITSSNEAKCTFDYLDPNDGVIIELLHTDKKRNPNLKGTIRGVPKGILDWGRSAEPNYFHFPSKLKKTKLRSRYFQTIPTFLMGVITILLGIFYDELADMDRFLFGYEGLFFGVIGFFMIGFDLFLLWTFRKRHPKSLMIDNIEIND